MSDALCPGLSRSEVVRQIVGVFLCDVFSSANVLDGAGLSSKIKNNNSL